MVTALPQPVEFTRFKQLACGEEDRIDRADEVGGSIGPAQGEAVSRPFRLGGVECGGSGLVETGNILGCAYMNALTRLVGTDLVPSAPYFIQDFGASVLQQAMVGPGVGHRLVENRHQTGVDAVRIPVAVKLSPYFTSLANFAARLDGMGVNGLVLFNRFLQPDLSLERMAAAPAMTLSSQAEALVPLRWIGILHGRIRAHLAASTGVYDAQGALKQLLAGAQVVQLASTLVKNGIPHLGRMLAGIDDWLDRRGTTLDEARGSLSQRAVQDPGAFERAQYVHLILSQNI